MDEVPAISTRVAVRQLKDSAGEIHLVLFGDGPRTLIELSRDGERDEEAEAERDQRVGIVDAGRVERDDEQEHRDPGHLEIAAQTFKRSPAPREERADSGEKEQEQADG